MKHIIAKKDKVSLALKGDKLTYSREGTKDKHAFVYYSEGEGKAAIVAKMIYGIVQELVKSFGRSNYLYFCQLMEIQVSGYNDFLISPDLLMAENICLALEKIGILGIERDRALNLSSKIHLAKDFARFLSLGSVK